MAINIHNKTFLSGIAYKSVIESLFLSKRLVFLILWLRFLQGNTVSHSILGVCRVLKNQPS